MSRIGRKPVDIPAGVEVRVDDKNIVTVKGPKGELHQAIDKNIQIEVKDNQVIFTRPDDERRNRTRHGLSRSLVGNMVEGVTKGFDKKLILQGVGYRAEKKGDTLVMSLGYSHPVKMKDPDGITTEVPDNTTIIVKGIDKSLVGNYAANIRTWREPEPYQGKGIRYDGEHVRRKEGKTGAK